VVETRFRTQVLQDRLHTPNTSTDYFGITDTEMEEPLGMTGVGSAAFTDLTWLDW
jgi:hypothetical protein